MRRQNLSKKESKKMDKLFVTTGAYTPKGFRVVKSIAGIDWENIEGIIYNDSQDDAYTVSSELVPVVNKLKFIIYINSELVPIIYGIFDGLQADTYSDSSLLEDEQILEFIVQQYHQNRGLTIKSPSQNFADLNRSLSKVLGDDSSTAMEYVSNKVWRKSVSETLAVVDTTLARADQINTEMVQIIGQAKEQTDKLLETNRDMTEQLESLHASVAKFNDGISSAPMIYSSYKVSAATKKVLFIKCYSHCTYLVSFLIAYQRYLKQTKMLDSRMLLVLPNLPIFTARYQSIPRLASETLGTMLTLPHQLYCTFEPKRDIMAKFFDGNNMLYIVVDEMYSNAVVSSGAKVEKFSAVSGLSDINRFNLDVSRTFFPVAGLPGGFTIPYITDYAEKFTGDTAKLSAYFSTCKGLYGRLDKILAIK